MKVTRLVGLLIVLVLLALPMIGCNSSNISLPEGTEPVEIQPEQEPEIDPRSGEPRAGESNQMNFNPGGLDN